MPHSTKEMLKLDAWLGKNEKAGIRSTPLRREGSVVRRARKTKRAKAVERQLGWRSKPRNRRKFRAYRKHYMRARRTAIRSAPTNNLQPSR